MTQAQLFGAVGRTDAPNVLADLEVDYPPSAVVSMERRLGAEDGRHRGHHPQGRAMTERAPLGTGLTTHRRFSAWVWRFGSGRHLHVHVRGLRRTRTRKRWSDQSFYVDRIEPVVMLVLVVMAWAACSVGLRCAA